MKLFRIVGIFFVILFILALVATVIASYYFYNLALNPKESKEVVTEGNKNTTAAVSADTFDYKSWMLKDSGYRDLYLLSFDGYWLHNYEIESRNDSHYYAIVVHGYMASAKSMACYAKYFYDRGYQIILPDLRGHGQSEGDFTTMGWYERLDLIQLIEYILAKDSEASIMLAGVSMGAAAVLMTSGEELPDNVFAVVEDCGYTSVKEEFSYQLTKLFSLPDIPLLYSTSLYTRIKDGYTFSEASTIEQVRKSKIPTLFIHGSDDTFVPAYMMEELYNACSAPKEKLLIKGAEHAQSMSIDPKLYKRTLDEFLSKYE